MVAGSAAAVAALSLGTADQASANTVWDRLAQCESGGNWSINTGNGYYGGVQFSQQSWQAVGGTGLPSNASKSEQIMRAQKLLAIQGPGAWPVCSVRAGLTSANGQAQGGSYTAPQQQAPKQNASRSQQRQAAPQQQAPKRQAAPQQQAPQQQAPQRQAAPQQAAPQQQAPKRQAAPKPQYKAPKAAVSGKTYTVKAGDSLSKIAEKLDGGFSWMKLFQANNDKISNPNLIFVGQVLELPAV